MKLPVGASSAFNWLLNIVSLVCCVLILWPFLHRTSTPKHVQPGSRLNLPYLSAYEGNKTVILALSTYCPYCKAEARFYRALASEAKQGHFAVIALLPQPRETISRSLESLGLEQVADVRQEDLKKVGAVATPTLILLDGNGTVLRVWRGQLSSTQEAQVSDSLGVPYKAISAATTDRTSSGTPVLPLVDANVVKSIINTPAIVVDVRPRVEFAAAHLHHALNIPYDELAMRSDHELPRNKPLFVYCYQAVDDPTSYCSYIDKILRRRGFRDLHYIDTDWVQLGKEGVRVVKAERN
jgi:thiol-disulfide isomerase/thioredoxin